MGLEKERIEAKNKSSGVDILFYFILFFISYYILQSIHKLDPFRLFIQPMQKKRNFTLNEGRKSESKIKQGWREKYTEDKW